LLGVFLSSVVERYNTRVITVNKLTSVFPIINRYTTRAGVRVIRIGTKLHVPNSLIPNNPNYPELP
jgi:hypothetical protein